MSFKAIAFATEQEVTRTSPQSHLLLILASYANDQDECYPSINTLVNKTRMSDKTVRKCLKELIELGLIADTQKTTRFGTKIYKIILNDNKDLTPSKFTTPSKSTTGKYSSTPSKSTSTPLVNLPPNPVIESVKESESNTRTENQNQKSGEPLKLNLDEIKTRFAMAGIIPSTGNVLANSETIGQELYQFNQYYAHLYMTESQAYAKLISWFKRIKDCGNLGQFFKTQESVPAAMASHFVAPLPIRGVDQ